jgi:hypothetical protein
MQYGKNKAPGMIKDLVTPEMEADIIESEKLIAESEGITYIDRLESSDNRQFKELVVGELNKKRPDTQILTYYKVFNINFITDIEIKDDILSTIAELSERLQDSISLAVQNKTKKHKNIWGTVPAYQPYSLPHHIKNINKLNKNTFKRFTKNSTANRG